eukprot:6759499-Prymnesium_polylepis.1
MSFRFSGRFFSCMLRPVPSTGPPPPHKSRNGYARTPNASHTRALPEQCRDTSTVRARAACKQAKLNRYRKGGRGDC